MRLVITASVLLNAVLLAVVGAMAASDHAAAQIAPRLHLAHEQQLEPIRREARATRGVAREANARASTLVEFAEHLRTDVEEWVGDLDTQVREQHLVVDEIRTAVEDTRNFTRLADLDYRIGDAQRRLALLEERVAALCQPRAC